MKKMLLVLLFMTCGILIAQQNKTEMTHVEKSLIGKWVSDVETNYDITGKTELKDKYTFEFKDEYKLQTTLDTIIGDSKSQLIEWGTWKLNGDKIELKFSGEELQSLNGKPLNMPKHTGRTVTHRIKIAEKYIILITQKDDKDTSIKLVKN